jgi:hypothetical protein
MRKIANTNTPNSDICRLMIYENKEGVCVFLYKTEADGPCDYDEWYENLSEAEQSCRNNFNVDLTDWKIIDDPLPGCQHDWIKPTKVRHD